MDKKMSVIFQMKKERPHILVAPMRIAFMKPNENTNGPKVIIHTYILYARSNSVCYSHFGVRTNHLYGESGVATRRHAYNTPANASFIAELIGCAM